MTRVGARGALGIAHALALAVLFAPPTALGAEPTSCVLHVEPAVAAAGSNFVVSGAGYTPTALVLQKAGAEPVRIDVELEPADAFQIPVSSRPGDEGLWLATAIDEAAGCSAEARFRVTLLDTAAIPTGSAADTGAPAAAVNSALVIYLLIIIVGFVGGVRVARRTRPGWRTD